MHNRGRGYCITPVGTTNVVTENLYISVALSKINVLTRQIEELSSLDVTDITRMTKLIEDLGVTAHSLRMVPLSATFFRMHRIVRDMCRQLDKDVQLELIGEDIEVDKTVVEHLADPIMHLIRNAMGHGIEPYGEREKIGKTSKAVVTLKAVVEGDDLYVSVSDNGRGFDKEKILEVAERKKLLGDKPAEEYDDGEIFALAFLDGFTTDDKITPFSGRGVGLDVVRTYLTKIHGGIWVSSTPGVGSIVTLKIPRYIQNFR